MGGGGGQRADVKSREESKGRGWDRGVDTERMTV